MKLKVLLLLAGFAVFAESACPGCDTAETLKVTVGSLDFQKDCTAYKTAYDCNAKCPDVQKAMTSDMADICVSGTDTLSPCGMKVADCVTDLRKVETASKENNKKLVCSDVAKFFKCAGIALDECKSQNDTRFIDRLKANLDEVDMEEGCGGECAASVGKCLKNLSADLSNIQDTTKFKDMCKNLAAVEPCITPLKKTTCASTPTNLKAADSLLQAGRTQLSDFCAADGTPSQCVIGYGKCGDKVKAALQTTDTTTQCSDLSSFLTCAERLPCKNSIEDDIKKQIQSIDSNEIKSNCPTIGGCVDRLDNCTKLLEKLKKVTPADSQFCTISKQIEACFVVVEKDPSCKLENLKVDSTEQKFFDLYGTTCGNGTLCYGGLTECYGDIKGVSQVTNKKDCDLFGRAVTCIDSLLKSDICRKVQGKLRSQDNHLKSSYHSTCDDGVMLQASLLLTVFAALASYLKQN
ncbi:uncharacterized protein LOC101858200 [Aplysia californica]|uniref:Uncharacterized protein LOC101858200 n=1 Tax=Aplysia californica TaxID=6500 RepID=A0ABM1A4J4_APLCA|nr:uncharacterized protein LOC101858200 [Aplysia californica]